MGEVGERWGVSVGTRRGGRADSCREGRGRSSGGPGRASDASSARDAPPRRSRRCSSRPAWRSSWRRGSRRTRRSPCSTGRRDAGWLPRPVPCGDSGAPSARRGGPCGALLGRAPCPRVCARFVSLFRRRAAAIRRRARVRSARWRAAPAASSVSGGPNGFETDFSESGFARFVTPKSNRRLGTRRSAPEAWRAARGGYSTRTRNAQRPGPRASPVAYAAARRSSRLAPPPPRDGRGAASVTRTPRRPRDVLAGGRPPRGFGDRVGRVRCGGLDRPGERHLSSPRSRRALLRAASVPRVDWTEWRYRSNDELAAALEDLHSGACAGLSALTSIGRSAKGEDIRVLEISAEPGRVQPKPSFVLIGNMHGDEPTGREFILRFARLVCLAASRARPDRTLVAGLVEPFHATSRSTTTPTSNTPTPPSRSPATRACSSSPPSIPTGSPRSDARTPTVAI